MGEERFPEFIRRARAFMARHPHLAANISPPGRRGYRNRRLLALLNEEKLRRVLARMLDENEFFSPFGIRALSRYHLEHPYIFSVDRAVYRVDYEPGESTSGLFGGNSNWRGPIWFPVNILLLRGLANLYAFYGNDFTVECPTGSGRQMNLFEVAQELGRRMIRIFLRDEQGARPVHGAAQKFQADPHWRDLILFYEYFHGDNGAGLGASHQTGWTGLVAPVIHLLGSMDAQAILDRFDRRDAGPAPRPRAGARPTVATEKGMSPLARPPRYPSLYQINTRAFLHDLGTRLGRPVTLDDIPDASLDHIAQDGFDWLWPLGVWQTGEAGRQVSLHQPDWQREYHELLPDFTPADVSGSPFAIREYAVHRDFGGPEALARVRQRLRARGVKVMLDFVPNHTALDHPWVHEHPEFYVHGSEEDLAREPHNYRRVDTRHGPRVLAHGRDPYFPGWPDTLQVNYRHRGFREAMLAGAGLGGRAVRRRPLRHGHAGPARGDRAARGETARSPPTGARPSTSRSGSRPSRVRASGIRASSSWPRRTGTSSGRCSNRGSTTPTTSASTTVCTGRTPVAVRSHLLADPEFQEKSVRFLENHDEPRAASAFAAVESTGRPPCSPSSFPACDSSTRGSARAGGCGRRTICAAGPPSPIDREQQSFYDRLFACMRRPEVRDGDVAAPRDALGLGGQSHVGPLHRVLLGSVPASGSSSPSTTVRRRGSASSVWRSATSAGRRWLLRDLLNPTVKYEREGDELARRGLYLDLPAWGRHVFEVTPLA